MRVSQRYTRNELPQTEAIQALICAQVIAELEKERRIFKISVNINLNIGFKSTYGFGVE